MSSTSALLKEIEAFLIGSAMGEAAFGQKAAGNGKIVQRLRSGGSCSLDTADKIRQFIASEVKTSSASTGADR